MVTRQKQNLSNSISRGNGRHLSGGGNHDLNLSLIVRINDTINPLMAAELCPNKRPTVFLGKGPLKSEAIICTPISGVNMSLVVAQISSPALPVVALLGTPVDDCAEKCVEGSAMV